jgi:hypothetical protein
MGGPLSGKKRESIYTALLRDIARVSHGAYTRVEDPAKVASSLPPPAAVDVDSVAVENADTGVRAERVELAPDGAFFALVPTRPGTNRIVVEATLSSGARARHAFELTLQEGAGAEPKDPAQAEARARLLAR